MKKKFISIIAANLLFWAATFPISSKNNIIQNQIKRLTSSGNDKVQFPTLSDDGRWMLYVLEKKENNKVKKSLRIMNIEEGTEKELFHCGAQNAPAPFQDVPLLVGSKPPALSGNGQVAVFSLSLGEPESIRDHYLAFIHADGTDLTVINFPISALKDYDHTRLDFKSDEWERVSNYVISDDGRRIASLLKGHMGPRRYGQTSGLVFLDTLNKSQRTILAPDFSDEGWIWASNPRRPLSGGGWAFSMSGNGEKVVFGAQSSSDSTDYDLYISDWQGEGYKKITDFQDRWFSQADISRDGQRIIFYYNGKKQQGIGTYFVNSDGSGLKYLESRTAPRIEFIDMSANGRYVFFKNVYRGMVLDLDTGQEIVAFDEKTPGYSSGMIPMDFPQIPAFWGAEVTSFRGDAALLIGSPPGKESPEIYLLQLILK